jgi:hypothetical protein
MRTFRISLALVTAVAVLAIVLALVHPGMTMAANMWVREAIKVGNPAGSSFMAVDTSGNIDTDGTIEAGSGNKQITLATGEIDETTVDPGIDYQLFSTFTSSGWLTVSDFSILLTPEMAITATTSGAGGPTQTETATNAVNFTSIDFDGASDEYAYWVIPWPYYGWGENSVDVHVYWTANSSSTPTVEFDVAVAELDNTDDIDEAFNGATVASLSDTFINDNILHHVRTTGALDLNGDFGVGNSYSLLVVRVMRDVSEDTMAEDAQLIGVRVDVRPRLVEPS